MKSFGTATKTKPSAKLFKAGTQVCEVLGFRSNEHGTETIVHDPPNIPAICCFTIPIDSPVDSEDPGTYELVFDNGARFPIRIRQVLVRVGGHVPSGRDISSELI